MHPKSSLSFCVMDKTCLSKYIMRITNNWTMLCVLLVLTVTQCRPALKTSQDVIQCQCLQHGDGADVCINGTETCQPPASPGKKDHCYAAWKNTSGEVKVESKGCWIDHFGCYDRFTCEDTNVRGEDEVYFCCCEGSFCNRNHMYNPQESTSTAPIDLTQTASDHLMTSSHDNYPDHLHEQLTPGNVPVQENPILSTILYSIVPIGGICIIAVVTFYMWRKHKMAYHLAVPTLDTMATSPDNAQEQAALDTDLRPLQLQKLIARGRYACVWQAQMLDESVAVKVFPVQDRNSFHTENAIYRLPLINQNPNVLRYIGAERRGGEHPLTSELWLITEFHSHGSLYDYLKGHAISWPQLLHMASGLVKGLAFLHEAAHRPPNLYKPAIAHRDFKSKNVLLKSDLSACVADFGLAMKFEQGCVLGDDHGQVGTRRYMAPEVLEGAINFNRDAFLRIDMYAVGLVLWELLSRCNTANGLTDEYHMPFEEEAGLHPSLEDMQEVVISKKLRPIIRDTWLQNEHLLGLCNTIEECWDQDPEARLSSGCVEERLAQLAHYALPPGNNQALLSSTTISPSSPPPQQQTQPPHHQPPSPPTLSPSAVVTMDTSLLLSSSTTTDNNVTTSSSELEDSGSSGGSSTTIPVYLRSAESGGETNAVYSPPNQLSSTRI